MRKELSKEITVTLKGYLTICNQCGEKEERWQNSEGRTYKSKMSECSICKEYYCDSHMHIFDEDEPDGWHGDHFSPQFLVCDKCKPEFESVWNLAIQTAGRYDDFTDLVERLWKERKQ